MGKSQKTARIGKLLASTACTELFKQFNMSFENDFIYHMASPSSSSSLPPIKEGDSSTREEFSFVKQKPPMNVGMIKYGGKDFCIQFGLDYEGAAGEQQQQQQQQQKRDFSETGSSVSVETKGDVKNINNGESKRIYAIDNGVCSSLASALHDKFYSKLKMLDFSDSEVELCYTFDEKWNLHQELKNAFVSFVSELMNSYDKIEGDPSFGMETVQDIFVLFVQQKVFKMLRFNSLIVNLSVNALVYVPLSSLAPQQKQ